MMHIFPSDVYISCLVLSRFWEISRQKAGTTVKSPLQWHDTVSSSIVNHRFITISVERNENQQRVRSLNCYMMFRANVFIWCHPRRGEGSVSLYEVLYRVRFNIPYKPLVETMKVWCSTEKFEVLCDMAGVGHVIPRCDLRVRWVGDDDKTFGGTPQCVLVNHSCIYTLCLQECKIWSNHTVMHFNC